MSSIKSQPVIVAFSGYKGSGKDSAASTIKEEYHDQVDRYGDFFKVTHINFADSLKELCSRIFNVPMEYFLDPALKEVIPPGVIIENAVGKPARQLLQEFGMQMRELYPSIWADIWLQKVRALPILQEEINVVLVTDLRYPDELKRIHQFKHCLHVSISHPDVLYQREQGILKGDPLWTHASESHVSFLEDQCDVKIRNGSTLRNLKLQADSMFSNYIERFYH